MQNKTNTFVKTSLIFMALLLTLSFVSALNLGFVSPTPAEDSTTSDPFVILNISTTDANSPSYTLYNDGLVAWYRFDNDAVAGEEEGSIFDWSGNENWAMAVNGASTTSDGHIVGGYNLDGNGQYIISQDLSSHFVDSDGSITISTWFRPTAQGVIVAEEGQQEVNTGWHTSMIEVLDNGDVKAKVWNLPVITLGNVQFGTWNHVVLRYNAQTGAVDGFLNEQPSLETTEGIRETPLGSGFTNSVLYAFGATDIDPATETGSELGSGAYFTGNID